MRELLQDLFQTRLQQFVENNRKESEYFSKAEKKKESLAKRSAEIVKVKAAGKILDEIAEDDFQTIKYEAHFQYLIKQKGSLYLEEEVEVRTGKFYKNMLISDEEVKPYVFPHQEDSLQIKNDTDSQRVSYEYNRLKAVQYAERWWNSYNPAYMKFENDCTNFISQCLKTGGAPMRGFPNRGNGWWRQNYNYSYSWAMAHSLRLYLANSKSGLIAKEVSSPDQLLLGDVICYDFEGDGRFNHNTIVTAKDTNGMPLVNAHTYNSRKRYWAYEDSSAYTPKIKYKFFSIIG